MKGAGNRERVLQLAVAGASHEQIAESLGLSIYTIRRHMYSKEMQEALRESRRLALTSAHAKLNDAVAKCLNVVMAIVVDEQVNPAVRLQAANSLMDRAGVRMTQGVAGGDVDNAPSEDTPEKMKQALIEAVRQLREEGQRTIHVEVVDEGDETLPALGPGAEEAERAPEDSVRPGLESFDDPGSQGN